ncbi:MAG: vWA domain-containing protein, partial [Isosphaeraceae bacterium]
MSVSRSLSFLWTPWSLGLSILLILITAGLGFVAWRRSGYSRSMGLLELLRLALVAIAAAMLNQPEWIEEYRPEEKPSVAVLWDASPSMETRDVVARGKSSSSPQSRREAVAPLAGSASWLKLRERMNVVVQPFSPPQPGRGTDLHEPLARALEKIQNLRGIVLASDGDWNEGPPPVQAAARLRIKGVPVFTVAAGSSSRLPDVELIGLDAPTFGV